MARNKTLLSLLQDYRAEIGASGNPAHNSSVRDTHVRALQRTQEWLWEEIDWPHLKVEREFLVQAGQRYYDVPDDMIVDRVQHISVRWGEQWVPLCFGIENEHMSTWDSDLDERSWPVERWDLYEEEQIELWPLPADNGDAATLEGMLKIEGTRNLRPLVADDDRADLDDRLIVLFAAANELAAQGSKKTQLVLQQAQRRLQQLRGNASKMDRFKLGMAKPKGRGLKGPPRVHYRIVGGS